MTSQVELAGLHRLSYILQAHQRVVEIVSLFLEGFHPSIVARPSQCGELRPPPVHPGLTSCCCGWMIQRGWARYNLADLDQARSVADLTSRQFLSVKRNRTVSAL